jgi:rubrerythrin
MNGRWFNPLEETPEGRLLKDVQDLLKSVKNKDKADLDKDGELSGYEKKRAKAIESSMARDGYKSDRGQKPAPKLPKAKKNKTVIKFDMSDNCWCGANPHEECKGGGEMRAIDCLKNPIAFDSRFDDAREHSMLEHIDEGHGSMLIARSDEKTQYTCKECGSVEVSGVDKNQKCYNCRMGKSPPKNKIVDTPKHMTKDIKKYSQESSVENLRPQFQNVDGGMPVNAHGFTTNQTYPATNDGPKKSIVSETAKMPAFAKTEYTPKGSSLHMHYNDAGGTRANPPNIDTIEQRLASLTKHAGRNNLGMIGEIEGLLKQVKDHLAKGEKRTCAQCKVDQRLGGRGLSDSEGKFPGRVSCPDWCVNAKND